MANSRYLYIYEALDGFGIKANEQVVDCSCGKGNGARSLMDQGLKVLAYDIDENAVRKAKLVGVDSHIGNLCSLPCEDASADIFVCSETLEHLDKKDNISAVNEIKRICKKGGYICITVPEDRRKCLINKKHKQYFTRDDILDLFNGYEKVFEGIFCKKPGRCNLVIIFKR